eukprot:CAMPEP_0114288446 /NCGR_PEP_ID=MMETSP0059-20121206/6812_1 /TAXON_ID=36894 /ORGANISM="Pyramimonas parkeae, Strain CCMP726" /LENGTH=173 /DNA_ID=CAMNT_0001409587 /DNA_START=373 /DNA_END=892 /DNA_ORIENTATION=+
MPSGIRYPSVGGTMPSGLNKTSRGAAVLSSRSHALPSPQRHGSRAGSRRRSGHKQVRLRSDDMRRLGGWWVCVARTDDPSNWISCGTSPADQSQELGAAEVIAAPAPPSPSNAWSSAPMDPRLLKRLAGAANAWLRPCSSALSSDPSEPRRLDLRWPRDGQDADDVPPSVDNR